MLLLEDPTYAWRSSPWTRHVCVRIQRLTVTQLIDNDQVAFNLTEPLRMNEGSNLASRQAFVDYCCHSSSTSYNGEQIKGKNIVKNGWMKKVKKGLCELRAST